LGQLDRHPNRAAHIHFIVSAPGYDPVITHIFPDDCRYLNEDTVFGVRETLISKFQELRSSGDAEKFISENIDEFLPCFFVNWDFVLTPRAT